MARMARMALDLALATSKALAPTLATAWQYAKVEAIPPMTGGFFQGAAGKNLENSVSQAVNGFISGLEQKIKDIDEAELKQIRDKEAAIKAEQEKQKAEAKKKDDDRKKIAAEKLAQEAKKAKEKAEVKAEKPKEAEKKAEPAKETKKKAPPPPKPPSAKKDEKKK